MMINLQSLDHWNELGEGEVLELRKQGGRTIALWVNAREPTVLMYQRPAWEGPDGEVYDASEPKFLAKVDGLAIVKFTWIGDIDVIAMNPVNVKTSEGKTTAVKSDGVKFTKIMERGPTNDLETLANALTRRFENQMGQQMAHFDRVLSESEHRAAERIAELEAEIEEVEEYDDDDESEGDDEHEEELEPAPDKRKRTASRVGKSRAKTPGKRPAKRQRSSRAAQKS